MGLDSYFIHKELVDGKIKIANDIYWPKVKLCGGIFSGDGTDGSFRGKVYADFVLEVCGVSLYEDDIDISLVAGKLEEYCAGKDGTDPETIIYSEPYEVTFGEAMDLAKVFRCAADNGLGYHAWY